MAPADPAEADAEPAVLDEVQAEGIHDDGRGHAEGRHVAERVVFLAEVAGGIGQPRHPAVERVGDHREQDAHRGVVVAPGHCRYDGVEGAEQGAGGEQVGQQVDALAPVADGSGFVHGECSL